MPPIGAFAPRQHRRNAGLGRSAYGASSQAFRRFAACCCRQARRRRGADGRKAGRSASCAAGWPRHNSQSWAPGGSCLGGRKRGCRNGASRDSIGPAAAAAPIIAIEKRRGSPGRKRCRGDRYGRVCRRREGRRQPTTARASAAQPAQDRRRQDERHQTAVVRSGRNGRPQAGQARQERRVEAGLLAGSGDHRRSTTTMDGTLAPNRPELAPHAGAWGYLFFLTPEISRPLPTAEPWSDAEARARKPTVRPEV